MRTPKEQLNLFVIDFRKWLSENYTIKEIENCWTDDPSYRNWHSIEDYFQELISKDLIKDLDEIDKTNLLYLIARNWDNASMLSWLYVETKLAPPGDLKEHDFIQLAKTLLKQKGKEFDDAKAQFVTSFRKFKYLTVEIERLLLGFYYENNEYIKRCAIGTLGDLGYSRIKELILDLWESETDDLTRRDCLVFIEQYLNDSKLLEEYVRLVEQEESTLLQEYIVRIKADKNYR